MLWLDNKLAQLCLIIDSALYSAVAWLYELFLKIAQTEIFTDSLYENLAQRIYIVLGVFMLFVLAYSLLTAIVNPDNITKGDKSMSKVATKLVTSLIIIGLLPTVFSYSRKLQNFILENNVIGTILFGNKETDITVREYDSDGQNYTEKNVTLSSKEMAQAQISSYGRIMSFTALNAFLNPTNTKFQFDAGEFTVNNGYVNTGSIMGCIAGGVAGAGISIFTFGAGLGAGLAVGAVSCGAAGATVNWAGNQIDYTHYTWDQMKWAIINDGDFSQIISLANVIHEGAESMDGSETVHVKYTAFVSTICAAFLLYLLASFCIDLGIRSVRLAFLQLIAPIPIFMRALPGKTQQFDKWLKKTLATYMEVFIRVFLMYLVVFFLSNVNINISTWQGLWVKVIIIMGCIAFVKVAPKEISEIIGIDSGNIKLGIMPKLAAGGALTGAALLGSGFKTGVNNATHGIKNFTEAKGFRGKTGALFRGIGSVGAGTLSGAVRGGYAGRGAKNLADMRKAAKTGAQGAIDARTRRESYRVTHAGHVGMSQIQDAYLGVKSWMGINNIDALKADQKILQEIFSKRKAAADAAEAEIMKQSGERMVSAGKEVVTSTGDVYKNLSQLDNVIELMKNKGVDANGAPLSPADLSKQLTELQNLRTKLKDNLVDDYMNGYAKNGIDISASNIVGPVKENLTAFNTLLKNNMNVINAHLTETDLSDPNIRGFKDSLENYVQQTNGLKMEEILGNPSIDLAAVANDAKKLVGTSSGNLGTQINEVLQRENKDSSGGGK
ncbi:MAG: hypothetical protein HFI09_04980 [Bacilli bacterium]|nr:hypothetical protein [Bacilli bacterium]